MAKVTLAAIVAATLAGSFVYAAPIEVASLVKAGEVEQNKDMKEGNKFATRATEAGIAKHNAEGGEGEQDNGPSAFVLEDNVEMPKSGRGGRKGDTYPFDKMAVGQSFFIAATAEKPNPAKAMASTVSSATARYAVGTGEFQTVKVKQYQVDEDGKRVRNEAGELIVIGEVEESREIMKQTRKFEVRAVEGGARIWRTA